MTAKKTIKCPACGKSATITDNPYSPFCSERCKMVDLDGWLGEKYYMPGDPMGREEEENGEER